MEKEPALVRVIFHGPTHVLKAFGQTVKRGESALFDKAEVFSLSSHPRLNIEVVEPEADAGEGQPDDPELKEEA